VSGLINMLRARYPSNAYAFFEELRNGTGYSRAARSADAVAFSLWPSRGLELMGFECKVSRSDWKRELDAPAKAEAIQQYCDRWWVVVSDASFVAAGELPPTWGLLAATKGFEPDSKLKVVKEAPKLEAKPLDRLMLASMFRNIADGEEARFRARADQLILERQKLADMTAVERELAHLKRVHQVLVEDVREFEKASGVNVMGNRYDGPRVGELLALVGRSFNSDSLARLRSVAAEAEQIYTSAIESAARTRERIDRVMEQIPKNPEAA
jgi:chloramphenicol 3-O-phosphotransferase